jgi:mannose-6-phosphate isomerase-like protein (cupin superfamily)
MNAGEIKEWLFERAKAEARGFGLEVLEERSCSARPWGAYLRFSEKCLPAFYKAYWKGVDVPTVTPGQRLDPKILVVAPGARLSLQYHGRRGEHWRVLDGPVKVFVGPDGTSLREVIASPGDVLRIPCGAWHRLEGMTGWGKLAEIWESTDMANPSDEDDIVRVKDDYGR